MKSRTISADDHIGVPRLPKDLWQKRVPADVRDRAPQVVDTSDGPWWVCGDASDDPHADSTWPDSRQAIEDNFQGVSAASRRRVTCDNARELYGL